MPSSSTVRRPNVLFIITDDHQQDALGVAGHEIVQTPVLDALARRGVRLPRATHAGSYMPAVCSPARACLLTGVNPVRANTNPRPGGGNSDSVTIPAGLETLPERFGAAGYETFFTGKWHNDRESLLRSFARADRIFDGGMCDHDKVPVRDREEFVRDGPRHIDEGFSTELFSDAMIGFLRERDREQPFFAWMALTSPHDPRTPPDEFRRPYEPSALPLPPAFEPEPLFDNGELEIRDEKLAAKPLTPEVIREHLADYYGMITHQDHEIGRVLSVLDETGATKDTIVVYIGDHGLALGRHGLLGKQNLYEHSVRVPLIIAGPGVPVGRVADGLAYSLDIYATLLELANLPVPDGLDSRSLVPLLRDASQPGRDELFVLYKGCQRMVRDQRWKLIEYRVNGENRIELFDLAEDPHEERDRSADPACAERVRAMRGKLVDWQERTGDRWMPIDLEATPMPARR